MCAVDLITENLEVGVGWNSLSGGYKCKVQCVDEPLILEGSLRLMLNWGNLDAKWEQGSPLNFQQQGLPPPPTSRIGSGVAGCAGDPGVCDGEDREAVRRGAALRPGGFVRRLDVRDAGHLHPVPGRRPHRRAAQVRRGSGEAPWPDMRTPAHSPKLPRAQ